MNIPLEQAIRDKQAQIRNLTVELAPLLKARKRLLRAERVMDRAIAKQNATFIRCEALANQTFDHYCRAVSA